MPSHQNNNDSKFEEKIKTINSRCKNEITKPNIVREVMLEKLTDHKNKSRYRFINANFYPINIDKTNQNENGYKFSK